MLAFAPSKFDVQHKSRFAADVRDGLLTTGQKTLPSIYLYDAVGSALFDAITLLPEYGLTRADEALLRTYSGDIAARCGEAVTVAELGSGSGPKTRNILAALGSECAAYYPIDVSASALGRCTAELCSYADVRPLEATYLDGLDQVISERKEAPGKLLVLFLGSTIGNFAPVAAAEFLRAVRSKLRAGDKMLIGADLVKEQSKMLIAYDDPAGVTAAFNKNVLARINHELDGNIDLSAFEHQARWNVTEQSIEMHLWCRRGHTARLQAEGIQVDFARGESIWTESSYKFSIDRLNSLAMSAGFLPEANWRDEDWPFAECLWSAAD